MRLGFGSVERRPLVVTGEGEQRGECLRCMQESQEPKGEEEELRIVGQKVTGTGIFVTASPTVVGLASYHLGPLVFSRLVSS